MIRQGRSFSAGCAPFLTSGRKFCNIFGSIINGFPFSTELSARRSICRRRVTRLARSSMSTKSSQLIHPSGRSTANRFGCSTMNSTRSSAFGRLDRPALPATREPKTWRSFYASRRRVSRETSRSSIGHRARSSTEPRRSSSSRTASGRNCPRFRSTKSSK